MKKVPKAFLDAVSTHRNRLEKTLSGHAAAKMKKLYDEAQGQLVSKLAKSIAAGKGDTFTAYQMRIIQAQLREGQAIITKRLAGNMQPLTKMAQEKALQGLVGDVKRLHKHFTGAAITLPIEEAATFAGVIQHRASSILRANQQSFARYGVKIVTNVEKEMALSMLRGESPSDVMDTVAEVIDGEWWQGERIVRTEMAYAYNATHRDGLVEAHDEIPDLYMQWQENCDEDGEPLDDRVAVDSIAMHGQVAVPGGQFTMPSTAPSPDAKGNTIVPKGMVGRSWDFPPNRPNDRAVLTPWMPDWGVPGWRYVGGKRVSM